MNLSFENVSLRRLGLFYRQLGSMLDAGVALDKSLGVAGQLLRANWLVAKLVSGVRSGNPLHRETETFPKVFRPWHRKMIEAGEESGALPHVLRDLAESCELRVSERSLLVRELIHPALTFHALFLLYPIPELFLGTISFGGYLLRAGGPLAVVYAVIGGGFIAYRLGLLSPVLRRAVLQVLHAVPVAGEAFLKLGIARLCSALRCLYKAGVRIDLALPIAGSACGNDVLDKACQQASEAIRDGSTLVEAIRATRQFPSHTISMLDTGEESGRLEQTLDRLTERYNEEARHSIRVLSRLLANFFYLLVALMVAVRVITFWTDYISSLSSI